MHRNGSDLTKRKNDILLIVVILAAALIFFGIRVLTAKGGHLLTVTIDGKICGTYDLAADRRIPITDESGENVLVINDGEVFMESADCPDQICVRHAKISKVGESIICLPHKIVAEITEGKDSGNSESTESNIDGISR